MPKVNQCIHRLDLLHVNFWLHKLVLICSKLLKNITQSLQKILGHVSWLF
jgi:hypothetical protein